MAVKAREIQSYIWKVITYSSITFISYTREFPCTSVSLLCLFLLYIFLPLIFWFLIYSVPFIIFAGAVLTASSSSVNGRNDKQNDENDQNIHHNKQPTYKKEKSMTRVHSVRRIRAKEIVITRDGDKPTDMVVEDKAAIVSSTSVDHDDVVDKEALTESGPKDIRVVSSSASRIKILADSDEEDGDDKNMRGIKDDDCKSEADLGISEIERIKRLESLIARRRSRKLLSFQIRRTLMNMDRNPKNSGQISNIPRLTIPKNNIIVNYDGNNTILTGSIGCELSPSPGSAPSVLVPMRNPFDLPYDPQEEKPNLSGTNLQIEPKEFDNRVTRFCRHESFSTRASFLPSADDIGESCPNKEGDEIKEIIRVHEEDCSARLNSSSSSSDDDDGDEQPFQKIDKEAVLKSLSSMARRNINSDEATECNNNNTKVLHRHTPSYSIASDLQVEVSEVSSPPLTIDENVSYRDEDASIFDGDVECNNKNWGSSLCLFASEEENELSFREIPEVTKQDVIEAEFSRNMRFEDTKTSNGSLIEHGDESEANNTDHHRIRKFETAEAEVDEQRSVEEEGERESEIDEVTEISETARSSDDSHQLSVEGTHSSILSPRSVLLLPSFSLNQDSISEFNQDIELLGADGSENSSVLRGNVPLSQGSSAVRESVSGNELRIDRDESEVIDNHSPSEELSNVAPEKSEALRVSDSSSSSSSITDHLH